MGDMGDYWRDVKEARKEQREKNLLQANPEGWRQHTEYHWSREFLGHRLDYWPSTKKWQYRGKVRFGSVTSWMKSAEERASNVKS